MRGMRLERGARPARPKVVRGAEAGVAVLGASLMLTLAVPAHAADPASPEPVPEAAPPSAPEPPKTPAEPALLSNDPGWRLGIHGFAELDADYDTTQSFTDTVLSNTISRPHTFAGDNPRFQVSPKDSRFGLKAEAPTFASIKASGVFVVDFFGVQPPNATQDQNYAAGIIRMREFYAKLDTPVIDVLAGQTQDLFGWQGSGFYPATPARLGVLGEVFHRNPQLRLSKRIESKAIGIEVGVAGVRPVQRDSAVPDVEAGLKLTINGWKGSSATGPRRPTTAPMAFGVSGIGRRLSVTDFSASPGDSHTLFASGVAVDAYIPIIPSKGDDLANALSVTGEFSTGSGISDLYLGLTGGVLFPTLPNPNNVLPAPAYSPNIDQGPTTFDANGSLHAINWTGLVVAAHYHLPFGAGQKLWISGTYSRATSSNAVSLTPIQGRNFVWDKGQYIDGTIWWGITPAFVMALSFQTMSQTFGDGIEARNNRGEGAWYFFF
jgi:hypothetical protein